jgi:diguanylate cyclase (GGDEF)-like protein
MEGQGVARLQAHGRRQLRRKLRRARERADRFATSGVSARQLLLVMACVAVATAMVTVAEMARKSADRHRRAQVLVETIRASGEQLNAIRAEALADALLNPTRTVRVNPALLATGAGAWSELSGALRQLQALEPDRQTATLQSDADALFTLGIKTLAQSKGRSLSFASRYEQAIFVPVIDRLNTDAQRASSHERLVADQSSSNASTAFVGSLSVGLLALLALTWRIQRLRRKSALDAARRAIESRSDAERRALEQELRHQAFHDSLTGLANRPLFEDRLSHALALARRRGPEFAVLFLDLDDFKTINDSLGHARGDDLLRAVAQRIAGIIRPSDIAARLGGDEFALLIELLRDGEDASTIARRILEALALPFSIGGYELRVTASVGVALWAGATDVEDLLRNADTAMYAAKADGKARIRTFEPSMHRHVLERLELTGELRQAIDMGEFELEYQPIVKLDTGAVAGVEALVRWQHPARSRLEPDRFICLAEETGLIVPLGRWILETACAQASRWQLRFPAQPLQLSVNVSTRQVHEPDFVDDVRGVLRTTGLRPGSLTLEITESLLHGDREHLVDQLEGLKTLGVRIAVDDFGTGYSSLSHLRHLPLDILKIDRSFVDGIDHDPGKAQLVRGIVNLGDSLLLDVVAEGIEHPEQAEQLRKMRLPLAQGFLFHPPLPAASLESVLSCADRPAAVPAAIG